jgi:hypothetical protein
MLLCHYVIDYYVIDYYVDYYVIVLLCSYVIGVLNYLLFCLNHLHLQVYLIIIIIKAVYKTL